MRGTDRAMSRPARIGLGIVSFGVYLVGLAVAGMAVFLALVIGPLDGFAAGMIAVPGAIGLAGGAGSSGRPAHRAAAWPPSGSSSGSSGSRLPCGSSASSPRSGADPAPPDRSLDCARPPNLASCQAYLTRVAGWFTVAAWRHDPTPGS